MGADGAQVPCKGDLFGGGKINTQPARFAGFSLDMTGKAILGIYIIAAYAYPVFSYRYIISCHSNGAGAAALRLHAACYLKKIGSCLQRFSVGRYQHFKHDFQKLIATIITRTIFPPWGKPPGSKNHLEKMIIILFSLSVDVFQGG